MIAIVPAKLSSIRVPNKNYREFYNGKSLVELVVEKLKNAGLTEIYLSCEVDTVSTLAERLGIKFVKREQSLCSNDCPIPDYIRGIVNECCQTADEVLWAQVCDPMFDDYCGFINTWEKRKENYDSSVVIYPRKAYFLDQNHQPVGFGFGSWHIKSQSLPTHYQLPFTASILKKEAIESTGYFVGKKPLWYEASGMMVDIDTEEDFAIAGAMYAATRACER